MGSDNEAESRLSLEEVPEQISRIFFGKGQSGGRPNYGGMGSSYQAPGSSYQAPGSGFGQNPQQGFYPNNGGFYYGYEEDLALTMKLGQAALIVFMILAAVMILFLLTSCCLSLTSPRSKTANQNQPAPFSQFPLEETGSPGSKPNLARSGGVVNLNLADTESDTASLSSGVEGGRRFRSGRGGRGTDSTDDGRQPTRFGDSFLNRPRSATPRNTTMTSPSTADTVIHVPQPGYAPSGQRTTPPGKRTTPPGKRTLPTGHVTTPPTHGRQISSNSDQSQPRSLPYYEVPSHQIPPTFSSKYNTSPPHSPPPPTPHPPYSFTSNQSKLI